MSFDLLVVVIFHPSGCTQTNMRLRPELMQDLPCDPFSLLLCKLGWMCCKDNKQLLGVREVEVHSPSFFKKPNQTPRHPFPHCDQSISHFPLPHLTVNSAFRPLTCCTVLQLSNGWTDLFCLLLLLSVVRSLYHSFCDKIEWFNKKDCAGCLPPRLTHRFSKMKIWQRRSDVLQIFNLGVGLIMCSWLHSLHSSLMSLWEIRKMTFNSISCCSAEFTVYVFTVWLKHQLLSDFNLQLVPPKPAGTESLYSY